LIQTSALPEGKELGRTFSNRPMNTLAIASAKVAAMVAAARDLRAAASPKRAPNSRNPA
jgi:hypothetical protein